MKSSWFVRGACAVFVLAIGGCPDRFDDLGPDGDLELGSDAGQSIEPIVTQKPDAGAKHDATVAPVEDAAPAKDAARDAEPQPSVEDTGCGDASPTDAGADAEVEPTGPSFAEVYAVIGESCVGCHGAGKPLDLSTPELAHAGLVGVQAQYPACAPDGSVGPVRVVAGDPAASMLIAKLEGTQTCGKQMPPKALLAADKIELFRAWVAAGAHAQ